MSEIKTIKQIDLYYDIEEECLYLSTFAERSKIEDSCLENISLEKVRELLEIFQLSGVECDLRTSELDVKELWN